MYSGILILFLLGGLILALFCFFVAFELILLTTRFDYKTKSIDGMDMKKYLTLFFIFIFFIIYTLLGVLSLSLSVKILMIILL